MSETGEMQEVPPDREMPSGEMREPDHVLEQEDMPAGDMEGEG
ncbi:MAG: hypothetical protein ACRD0N_09980 [Acidimicrobiales bacterium]